MTDGHEAQLRKTSTWRADDPAHIAAACDRAAGGLRDFASSMAGKIFAPVATRDPPKRPMNVANGNLGWPPIDRRDTTSPVSNAPGRPWRLLCARSWATERNEWETHPTFYGPVNVAANSLVGNWAGWPKNPGTLAGGWAAC